MKFKNIFLIMGLLLGLKASAQTDNICDRSEIIVEAIESAVSKKCEDIGGKDLLQVTILEVVSGTTNTLATSDLQGMENLTHVDLSYIRLTEIPENFFQGVPYLEWVDLTDTGLGKAAVDTLRALFPQVEFVY